jgi:hypothetical protein
MTSAEQLRVPLVLSGVLVACYLYSRHGLLPLLLTKMILIKITRGPPASVICSCSFYSGKGFLLLPLLPHPSTTFLLRSKVSIRACNQLLLCNSTSWRLSVEHSPNTSRPRQQSTRCRCPVSNTSRRDAPAGMTSDRALKDEDC